MKEISIKSKIVGRAVDSKTASKGGAMPVDLSAYLPKAVWEKVFKLVSDEAGNEHLFANLPFASKYGITMFADDGSLNLPNIYDGLPIDWKTIYWEDVKDADGNVIGRVLKAAGGGGEGGTVNGITLEQLEAYLGVNKYATQPWVEGKGYALKNDIPTKLSQFTDDIVSGKYLPITGNAASASKLQTTRTIWGQSFDGSGDITDCLHITTDARGDYTQGIRINMGKFDVSSVWLATVNNIGYDTGMWGISASNKGNLRFRGGATSVSDLMNITQSGNVLIGTTTDSGYKLDVNGSTRINGIPIYKSQDDVLYIDGNLAVRGGVTMYATDAIDVPTIMNSIATDEVNLKVIDGVLTFVGRTGGGVADSVRWENVIGRPTLLSSFTDDVGYLKTSSSSYIRYSANIGGDTGGDKAYNHVGYAYSTEGFAISGPTIAFGVSTYYANIQVNPENGEVSVRLRNPSKTVNKTLLDNNWVGSSKITTLGTITSGAWNGSKIANAYLVNSAVTISGTSVSLGGSITQAALRTALGLGSNAYTSTAYLPLDGSAQMTGIIYTPLNKGIYYGTSGLLAYLDNSNTWTGVSNMETVVVGTSATSTTIRTSDNNLYHYNHAKNARYSIWDGFNSNNYSSVWRVSSMNIGSDSKTIGTDNGESDIWIKCGNTYMLNCHEQEQCVRRGKNATEVTLGSKAHHWKTVYANTIESFSSSSTSDGGYLIINAEFELALKYNNVDAQSVILNSSAFKPYKAAADNIMLGNASSRWKGVYVGAIGDSAANTNGVVFCDTAANGKAMIGCNYVGGFGIYACDKIFIRPSCTSTSGAVSSSGIGLEISSEGLLCSGGITMYSDIRKKIKLKDVELSLQQIADAPLIEHYYNSDSNKTTHVGSIAQYWAGMNDWFCKLDNEGYYTMEIQNAALASAISIARELQRYESKTDKKIRLLKKRIGELEDEIEKLKTA